MIRNTDHYTRFEWMLYFSGERNATRYWAHWKDGIQYVGSCGTTLKEALDRIDKEEASVLASIKE